MEPIEQENVKVVHENQPETKLGEKRKASNMSLDEKEEVMSDDLVVSWTSTDDEDSDDTSSDESTDYDDVHDLVMETLLTSDESKGTYKILCVPEIEARQQEDISKLCNLLSIGVAEARHLLFNCDWDIENISERWFADEKKFRNELGLLNEKSGTVNLAEKVVPVADQYMANLLASEETKNPRISAFVRAYIPDASKGKWCPTTGCEHAVVLDGHRISKFTCKCLYTYCYRCLKEAHQPVSCGVAETWRTEELKQARNWSMASTRSCPQCHRGSLEANALYKRIFCPDCKLHFCRACLDPWFVQGNWLGDQYIHVCPPEKQEQTDEAEKKLATAYTSMSHFKYYLAQWRNFHMGQHQALSRIPILQNHELKALAEKQGLPEEELSFVTDAWLQAAECKRVLKWAGVYDHYFLNFDDRNSLFHDLIKQGLFVLEQLFKEACQLNDVIRKDAADDKFILFRENVCLKSSVARNFFENIEMAIQRGLSDLDTLRWMMSERGKVDEEPEAAAAAAAAEDEAGTSSEIKEEPVDETKEWECQHCKFNNNATSGDICVMCYH